MYEKELRRQERKIVAEKMMSRGKISVIGIGPGEQQLMTEQAITAIKNSDCITGYKTYVALIADLIESQEVVQTLMAEEVERAQEAVKLAETGKKVAVVSSGDAGVYGMAGLVYEVLVAKNWNPVSGIELEIIPGISAVQSCASLLGAPLMHDYCSISLSDHLTPWEVIRKRIAAAGDADFVIAFYNPKSSKRINHLAEAQKILLQYRAKETPVGIVTNAYRDKQRIVIVPLSELLEQEVGMTSTVIVGNSATFIYENKMITPRGYHKKYDLAEEEQQLKLHQRLQKEAEPWSLNAGKLS